MSSASAKSTPRTGRAGARSFPDWAVVSFFSIRPPGSRGQESSTEPALEVRTPWSPVTKFLSWPVRWLIGCAPGKPIDSRILTVTGERGSHGPPTASSPSVSNRVCAQACKIPTTVPLNQPAKWSGWTARFSKRIALGVPPNPVGVTRTTMRIALMRWGRRRPARAATPCGRPAV